MDNQELYVVLSADSFQKLMKLLGEFKVVKEENQQLRRELDGLRQMFSELMETFGDLKRML